MLSADLVLKGLGGVAVVGGATTVGVCYQQEKWIFAKKKVEILTLEELTGKVGLSCKGTSNTEPTATAGVECSKKAGEGAKNIKVKKDTGTFDATSITGGKIKVYKTSTGETYNNDFKFVIEEADVTTNDTNNKLEEFETYEIKKEGKDDWSLTRKDKASVLKGKLLGLSGDCKLPEDGKETTCSNLTAEDLKKIKFDGKQENGTVTIEPTEGAANISLKISKTTDAPFESSGYKFVLETNKNISVPKSSGAITIKKGTNTEFKIKTNSTAGSPKTLTLEKAWTLDTLIAKVGISSCTTSGTSPKECTFTTSTKVNLFNGASDYTKGASVKSEDASKKIKVEEDQENHNQGFKFYVAEESSEITLQNGTTNQGDGEKKITKKDTTSGSPTYEIKQQTVGQGGTKDWYLSKVTNSPGGA